MNVHKQNQSPARQNKISPSALLKAMAQAKKRTSPVNDNKIPWGLLIWRILLFILLAGIIAWGLYEKI